LGIDTVLATIHRPDVTREKLCAVVTRLHVEGFVTLDDWGGDDPACAFRNPLLRRWWHRHPPA
jgi:hypothetical protein